ncbi:hypothetical protein CCM_07981 [Cordyceps militaris CM01]|uniref:Uncharacterized protein n=1 Tax=Cordyceps militaris (strain CM01) TaxID=983644 RepID=G3JPB9_CORMM|nr:uncharacterized protein CCM_07981 [Cordyceps militaris CM01]EGX89729.1 hypothetical protein CCM_07981 [Cordyceps militaris CM01]
MKIITFAILSLLPLIGAAVSGDETQETRLPWVPGDLSDHTKDAAESRPPTLGGHNAENMPQCTREFPFLCLGRCCRRAWCCRQSCCGPLATFCGDDGNCYYRVHDLWGCWNSVEFCGQVIGHHVDDEESLWADTNDVQSGQNFNVMKRHLSLVQPAIIPKACQGGERLMQSTGVVQASS